MDTLLSYLFLLLLIAAGVAAAKKLSTPTPQAKRNYGGGNTVNPELRSLLRAHSWSLCAGDAVDIIHGSFGPPNSPLQQLPADRAASLLPMHHAGELRGPVIVQYLHNAGNEVLVFVFARRPGGATHQVRQIAFAVPLAELRAKYPALSALGSMSGPVNLVDKT